MHVTAVDSTRLSEYLAHTYPKLTIPMLSGKERKESLKVILFLLEITARMETCCPARRAALERLLVPWLHNVELTLGNECLGDNQQANRYKCS